MGVKGMGVIHIGFLSRKKYDPRTEKLHVYKNSPRGLFGFLLSSIRRRDINVPQRAGSIVLFRTCEFSWIPSSSPPAQHRRLFRAVIHPDLSRAPRVEDPRSRPPPDFVGTRTTSVPHPVPAASVPGTDVTALVTCPSKEAFNPV